MKVDSYDLYEEIYQGDSTALYVGLNKDKEPVVVKFFQANGENKATKKAYKQLFKQEAKILEELIENRIPNTIRLDSHKLNGNWETENLKKASFIATKFVPAPFQNCYYHMHDSKYRRLTNPDVKNIGIQLLETINKIHAIDYIHMDLHPGNILMNSVEQPQIIICDFGIARKKGEPTFFKEKDSIEIYLGAPGYYSVEYLNLTAKTGFAYDLYSISTTLLFLLGAETEIRKEREQITPYDVKKQNEFLLNFIDDKPAVKKKKINLGKAEVLKNALKLEYKTAQEMLKEWKKA